MFLVFEIIISIIISSIPLVGYYLKKKKDKSELLFSLLSFLILFIGCLIRIILIERYPVGLNQDEASIGYEAYSLSKYGIDRNGMFFPIHFIAWGSGQNVLYAYILIPFIKLFGINNFILRLPMAVVGCLTLLVSYFLFSNAFTKKNGLIFLFVFSITPWHIMKSRWALESNIFPDLIFYSISLIYFSLKSNKKRYFIISSIILGISTYAYGTSYLFVPIFSVITYLYLVLIKKISIKDSLIYISITTIVSIPMIIFVIINYFNLNTIRFLITIPKLYSNRFTSLTSINGNVFTNGLNNFKMFMSILTYQSDGFVLNYIPKFGLFYKCSLPIMVIGFIYSLVNRRKNILLGLNNLLFISSLMVVLFTEPNINRINIIWISFIIYLGLGFVSIYNLRKFASYLLMSIYFVLFIFFIYNYFNDYQSDIEKYMFNGLEDAIIFTNKMNYDKLYITNQVNQPYIYYLYYNRISADYYMKEVVIKDKYVAFQDVKSIDNVYFSVPNKLKSGNVYILDNNMVRKYDVDNFKVITFNNYNVIY